MQTLEGIADALSFDKISQNTLLKYHYIYEQLV